MTEPKARIEVIPVGFLDTNCYLIYEDDTRLAALIDPGEEPQKILRKVTELGLTLKYIIHTHGHFDHVGADRTIKEKTGAAILIHQADAPMLDKVTPERLIHDGETIELSWLKLRVLHTPGHSPGGICLVGSGYVFTGDTLFQGAVGRTDLQGGNEEALFHSIREKLMSLPDGFAIYPGHGPESTIGQERKIWKS